MPRISVWLIRASLVHLLAGALLGAAYLAFKAVGWPPSAASGLPAHQEALLVGWMVQLVIGVAFYILPRPPGTDLGEAGRLMWLVFWLLNLGVLVAALGGDPALPSWLVLVGRLAESAAVVLFARHAWFRQRAYRAGARTALV